MRERTRTYRVAMALNRPVALLGTAARSRAWRRCPRAGRCWSSATTTATGTRSWSGSPRVKRRQIRALAKSDLWKVRGLAPILNGMGQIPIERGNGDKQALARAIEALRAGVCIGVFPEGTRSRGEVLRARSGVGRLALEVPEAHVTLVAIEGTSDLTGFPRRPRAARPLLRPGRRPAAPRRGPGRALGPAPGRDPRARPALDLLPQARQEPTPGSSPPALLAAALSARTTRRRRSRCRCRWLRPASCRRRRCRAGGRRR